MKNISTESTYFEKVPLEPHSLALFVGEKEEKIGGHGIVKGDQQKYSTSEEVFWLLYRLVWDQRGSKWNLNNDRASKESLPETPGNVNRQWWKTCIEQTGPWMSIKNNAEFTRFTIGAKSVLLTSMDFHWCFHWFFQWFFTFSHEAAPSNQGLLVRGVATVEARWIPSMVQWWMGMTPETMMRLGHNYDTGTIG